jgi:predicted aminopeptidase
MKSRTRTLLALLPLATILLFAVSPLGCYLSRAGWEEAKILKGRKDITEVIADPATDSVTRRKLALVLDARRFAIDSLGLKAKKSFTQYTRLKHDTLVLLLSAAEKDRLRQHTWWFPIVGRVPYKGYFNFGAARDAAKDFEKRGYDVYLRPAAAFSTLGFFNDPVLSTTLRTDSLNLASTVIHELTHNTFYAKGQAIFNESFAEFVGARGASWLFETRGYPAAAAEVEARWADDRILSAFWERLYKTLDSAFKAYPESRAARLAVRDTIYAQARRTLVDSIGPQLKTVPPRYLERVRLDNAALLARRVYSTDLSTFERVFRLEGRDLRRTITRIVELGKANPKDPFAALQAWSDQRERTDTLPVIQPSVKPEISPPDAARAPR